MVLIKYEMSPTSGSENSSPEHEVIDLDDSQWNQEAAPSQNPVPQQWTEQTILPPPPPPPLPPTSTSTSTAPSPVYYNVPPSFTTNGSVTYSPNVSVPARNDINGGYVMNGSYLINGSSIKNEGNFVNNGNVSNGVNTINAAGVMTRSNVITRSNVNGANLMNTANIGNGGNFMNGANLMNGGNLMNGARAPMFPSGITRPNFVPNMLNNGYHNAMLIGRHVRPLGAATQRVNGVKKQKRNRTAFTSQQMMELEQEYVRTRYLDRNRRNELSELLNLNQRTIKIWFQNRRMKEKKDRAESLESEEVSTTESSPEMMNEVPMVVQEQYPVMVAPNEIYNRDLYMEQYPVVLAPANMPDTLPDMQNQMPTDFVDYMPESTYAPQVQKQQVHLQVQHYAPSFDAGVQEVPPEPPTPSTSNNAPNALAEQNWDLSWIRALQTDDEL